MSQSFLDVLTISGIGIGLVFSALGLLWAVIALLVRLLSDRPAPLPARATAKSAGSGPGAVPAPAARLRQQQAAAVAVAVALALAREAEVARPLLPGVAMSPWQSVNRGRGKQVRERGPVR